MPDTHDATVIGAGLAGSEAAWQLATRGMRVRLVEMRPVRSGPAHTGDRFAELVCSNSLKSDDPATPPGCLKRELEAFGSLVMRAARHTSVPAGAALAVDRDAFAAEITAALESHELVTVVREEASAVPEGPVIVATGPLTSPALEAALDALVGSERLAFYDAAAPVVDAATVDASVAFAESRHGKGEGSDYLNCPFDRDEYEAFIDALLSADRVVAKAFEARDLFSACQPIEQIARAGRDAPRFGPMRPIGLTDPRTGHRPWAVVQLRAENRARTAYNLVGFQTNLTFPEQRRIFRLIPGLQEAEFLRFGVMHRNTFIDAPKLLAPGLSLREHPDVWIAGQLSGTEGYLEAAGTGMLAALNVVARLRGLEPVVFPADTALGALVAYATDPDTTSYQPMHVNWGLVPPLPERVAKRERRAAYAARARESFDRWLAGRPDLAAGGAD